MANTNITSGEAVGFIPEIWLAVALGQLRAYLTACKSVTMDRDLKGGTFTVGDTLKLPKRGALVVNDKAENANYTVQNPSSSDVTLILNKHKEVTVGVESRALSVSNQDIIAGYTQDAVIVLAEQVDKDLLAFMGASTTNPVIVGGAALTEANIQSGRKILVDNRVPASTDKFGVISTSQTNGLLAIDRLVRYDSLGVSNNIADATVGNGVVTIPGAIGKLYNFEIAESQLLTFASTFKNIFYAKDAVLFASRELEIPEPGLGVQATVMTDPASGLAMRLMHGYNLMAGAHQLTLEILYGFQYMRPEHIQVVTTTA